MSFKNTFFSHKTTINCKGELVDISKPKVMGILNITPDSFYDGGTLSSISDIEIRIKKMIDEGADFIDIGACSTRPGAEEVTYEEELERLKPVLELINTKYPETFVSIDTYRSRIAREVVENYDVCMINDISAGEMDSEMFDTIADLNVPYVMMHMKGTPENMQVKPEYDDLLKEIIRYFHQKINVLKEKGLSDLIVDPGFGFGKTLDHNYQILNNLDSFQLLELPILIGLSRKSMIYKLLDQDPSEALNGTSTLNTVALMNGANILRVHDVKVAKENIKLVEKLKSSSL